MTGSVRPLLAGILWLIASLAVLVSSVTLWAHQSLLTSAGWTSLVAAIASDRVVIEDTSAAVVGRVAAAVGLDELVVAVLPGELERVGAAIASQVEAAATEAVVRVASSDEFQAAFIDLNRVAHDAALAVIRDEPGVRSTREGTISLNVLPFVGAALEALQEAGFIDAERAIPALTSAEPASENVARLEEALGRELPPDVGTITLIESAALGRVQAAVRAFDVVAIGLIILTLLAMAHAVWLARARVRMVLWLAVGAIAALGLGRVFVRFVLDDLTSALRDGPTGRTVQAVVEAAVDQLMWFTFAAMAVAVVVAGLTLAYERRGRMSGAGLGAWIFANPRIVASAGLAVIGFLVLWDVAGPDAALLAASAVGLWLVAVGMLAREAGSPGADSGRREPSPPPTEGT